MLVVRVELWPGGNPRHVEQIGMMTVTNDGTGSRELGNYVVVRNDVIGEYQVTAHERWRSSVWELVNKAIEATNETEW